MKPPHAGLSATSAPRLPVTLERAPTFPEEGAAKMVEANSLGRALRECLARICSATGWDLGETWTRQDPECSAAG